MIFSNILAFFNLVLLLLIVLFIFSLLSSKRGFLISDSFLFGSKIFSFFLCILVFLVSFDLLLYFYYIIMLFFLLSIIFFFFTYYYNVLSPFKSCYRTFLRFNFLILNYIESSFSFLKFFNKLFIMFPRILFSLNFFKHFRKRHPINQTVSFRWKSVPLGSMEDLSLASFCRALESHFFDWDKRFTDRDDNKYTPKTCVETRFFLYELLDRSLSYPGTVNLITYLVTELDAREKIAELRLAAWEANGGGSEHGRELYYLDLDLSVFFPLKEDLKYFLYLLDLSLMEEVRLATKIEQMRFNLIQFLYPYQSYLSYFLPFVKTYYWTLYPFQHYYLFFVFSLVSLLSHFLFYYFGLSYLFFFFYFFIIADFILELDHVDNLLFHLILNISIFFFGFLGYLLAFLMMLFSWCVFFNKIYFYHPMEYYLPIYFD